MKLILPKNIFTEILKSALTDSSDIEIVYNESSLICKSLEFNTSAVALIPVLELVNHKNLFVSQKAGIAFDGALSNSYFYFIPSEKSFQKIYLRGDVSLNEILLSKILFAEKYSSKVDITLDTSKTAEKGRDFVVVGDENFKLWDFDSAISIAEEVSELIDHPYVNFVFASRDKDSLTSFDNIIQPIDSKIEDNIESVLKQLQLREDAELFIKNNINSLYFDMTENEADAVNELIKLVYYHGIIDDMFDAKFL